MTEIIKKAGQETTERLLTESSKYFKPFIPVGGGLAIVGLIIKFIAATFPATMPIGLVSLAPEMIAIGITMFTQASLSKEPGSTKESTLSKVIGIFTKKK